MLLRLIQVSEGGPGRARAREAEEGEAEGGCSERPAPLSSLRHALTSAPNPPHVTRCQPRDPLPTGAKRNAGVTWSGSAPRHWQLARVRYVRRESAGQGWRLIREAGRAGGRVVQGGELRRRSRDAGRAEARPRHARHSFAGSCCASGCSFAGCESWCNGGYLASCSSVWMRAKARLSLLRQQQGTRSFSRIQP
eukprot:1094101-Rhodomonas_salina.3